MEKAIDATRELYNGVTIDNALAAQALLSKTPLAAYTGTPMGFGTTVSLKLSSALGKFFTYAETKTESEINGALDEVRKTARELRESFNRGAGAVAGAAGSIAGAAGSISGAAGSVAGAASGASGSAEGVASTVRDVGTVLLVLVGGYVVYRIVR